MPDPIPIASTLSIRDCDLDEVWLQDQIAENPSSLQLGELVLVSRERQQRGGGRLDLLLVNLESESMYEVEIMLGKTDESHIVRTIEYWDRERRKWPQRQHFAVLVAESITSRFFNVVQLLSHCIPIIAVQANIVDVDGKRALHFSKVLDTYEEPEVEMPGSRENRGEPFWEENAPWVLHAARAVLETVRPVWSTAAIRCVKSYITIAADGDDVMWLWKKGGEKAALSLWVSEALLQKAEEALDAAGIPHTRRKDESLLLTVDEQMIRANTPAFSTVASLMQKSWDEPDE
jgi:hypothetical protein